MDTYAAAVDAVVNEHKPASASRMTAAVVCGIFAGVLTSNSLHVGFRFLFSRGPDWSLLFWGEHWVLRVAASLIAAITAGSIAGAVARDRGQIVSAIATVPAALIWLGLAVSGWREEILFLAEPIYVSIGNKLAASAIALLIIPAAQLGGKLGEEVGRKYGEHFDSRKGAVFGIKWYHYLWLPIPFHMILAQMAWAGLYGFEWLKMSWRAGPSLGMFVPTIFVLMLWGTFVILGKGVSKAYRILAGFEPITSSHIRAGMVLKYGFGLPVLAWILQAGIMALHYGLAQLAG